MMVVPFSTEDSHSKEHLYSFGARAELLVLLHYVDLHVDCVCHSTMVGSWHVRQGRYSCCSLEAKSYNVDSVTSWIVWTFPYKLQAEWSLLAAFTKFSLFWLPMAYLDECECEQLCS